MPLKPTVWLYEEIDIVRKCLNRIRSFEHGYNKHWFSVNDF